jgi:hypothetical protein
MHWELYGAKLTKITIRSGCSSRRNQDERLEAAKLWHHVALDKLMCIIWIDEDGTASASTTTAMPRLELVNTKRATARSAGR